MTDTKASLVASWGVPREGIEAARYLPDELLRLDLIKRAPHQSRASIAPDSAGTLLATRMSLSDRTLQRWRRPSGPLERAPSRSG
jgi:hypothetical protein